MAPTATDKMATAPRPRLAKHPSTDEDFNAFSASARSLELAEDGTGGGEGGNSSRSLLPGQLGLSSGQLGLSGRSWETARQEQHASGVTFDTAATSDEGPAGGGQAAESAPATLAATDQPGAVEAEKDGNDGGTTAGTAAEAGTDAAQAEAGKKRRYATPKDFELLKVIGMGAFGKVLQVRNRASEEVLAMKVISKRLLRRKTSYVENVQAERDILTKCNHPFVVTMHCSFQTKEKLFIIMDFLAGGELFLRLGREGIFLERVAAFYLGEIVLALEHLHGRGVLHRDLKPENILLSTDGHLCVTDFGLAKEISTEDGWGDDGGGSRTRTVCGTQEYMAPEMVARQGYGKAADFWSLGCISYEMLAGRPPFESRKGSKDLFQKIMNQRVKMPDGASASACRLLKGLLNRNAQARLGAARGDMFNVGGIAGLKQQAFFDGLDWVKLENKEIDPPESLDVDNDEDLRHFHDEFTKMTLPRSVTEMHKPDFQPHHCNSDMFRGFSFVHDDFALPERPDNEDEDYWNSIDSDGQSMSGASSAFGDDIGEGKPVVDQPPVVEKKKRPPRKKKKKKATEATSDSTQDKSSTPSTSILDTEISSKLAPVAEQQKDEGGVDAAKDMTESTPVAEKRKDKDKLANKPTSQSHVPKTLKQPNQPPTAAGINAKRNPPAKKFSEKWETVKKGPQQGAKQVAQCPPANRTVNLSRQPAPTLSGGRQQPAKPAVSGGTMKAPPENQTTYRPAPGSWAAKMAQTSAGGQNAPAGAGRSNFAITPAAMGQQVSRGTHTNGSPGTPNAMTNNSDWRCHSMQSPGKNSPYKKTAPPQAGGAWPSLGEIPAPPLNGGESKGVDPMQRKAPNGSWAAKSSTNQTNPSRQRATKR